jgi:uncharacterized protein (DUF58 family)
LNSIAQRLNESFSRKVQDWARRRQGVDPHTSRLASRRIYILPTRPGVIYAAIVFTMLLGSMNYNNNLGFAMTFLLAGIGIISIYHCHRNLADAGLKFSGSQPAFAGESVRFNFVIENPSPYTRAQLRFGHGRRQEICDRLAENERQNVSVRIDSPRRGRLVMPRLLISTRYPLGLFRAWAWINMDVQEIVYPQPDPAAPKTFTSSGGHATSGHRSPGDDDFTGLKNYQLGDPPKRIAWKVFARTGETLITEYHGGAQDLVWINWNDYPAISPEQRLSLLARRILDTEAAGIAWGLRIPDRTIGPASGTAHQHECLTALALFETGTGIRNT